MKIKSYFKDHEAMLAEADQLITEDRWDAEDRATIQDFYNGRETMTKAEAELRGTQNVTNHLFGYDSINLAQTQLMGLYTKDEVMWNLKFPHVVQHDRRRQELCATQKWNAIMKKSRRFKPEWKSLTGEATLHGNGTLMFLDNEDWCPRFRRLYVPRGTGILADEVPYCVAPDYLTLPELETALEQTLDRKDNGWPTYWKEKDLRITIDTLKGNIGGTGNTSFTANNISVDEQREQARAGADNGAGLRTRIPVYYFYYKNENGSFDLTILPRLTATQKKEAVEKRAYYPRALYERKDLFEKPCYFLHPFFIDCEIGGRSSWHRVMGLGRLNYQPDVEAEEFFNDAMQGSREQLRRLYQVGSAADWEMLKTWASGSGPTNVLPPGVTLAEARMAPNFQHAFTAIDMLMGLSRKNSTGHIANPGDQKANELEVNAIERQGRNAEALSSRIADIYECCDALGHEIFRRFIAESPMESDSGYKEIMEFQRAMKAEGISLAHLRAEKDEKYINFDVKTSRAVGDGSKVKQAMANQMMMQRLPLFSAEAQQIILRRITAEETGDYDFAKELVPYQKKEDPDQIQRADQENDTCDKQGIIGAIPQLNNDDLHPVHLGQHFKSMQADLARAEVRPWDKVDLAGFKAKGGHCAMHVQALEQNPEGKDAANQFKQQLQALAKQGQEHEQNINQQQEKNNLSPVEQKDIEIKERKQSLAEQTLQDLNKHRGASLDLARQKAEVGAVSTARNTALQEQSTFHKERMAEADRVMAAQEMGAETEEEPDGPIDVGQAEEEQDNPVP